MKKANGHAWNYRKATGQPEFPYEIVKDDGKVVEVVALVKDKDTANFFLFSIELKRVVDKLSKIRAEQARLGKEKAAVGLQMQEIEDELSKTPEGREMLRKLVSSKPYGRPF